MMLVGKLKRWAERNPAGDRCTLCGCEWTDCRCMACSYCSALMTAEEARDHDCEKTIAYRMEAETPPDPVPAWPEYVVLFVHDRHFAWTSIGSGSSVRSGGCDTPAEAVSQLAELYPPESWKGVPG